MSPTAPSSLAAAALVSRFAVASGAFTRLAAAFAASREAARTASVASVNASQSPGCSWAPPAECAPTFQYGGQTYSGCCTAGSSTGWCSHTDSYSGAWSGCTWTCQEVPGQGPVVMPYANDWVPSADEVQYMSGEAERKEGIRAQIAHRQEELQKMYDEVTQEADVATKEATEAQQKAAIANALAEQERKRIAALPALARAAQEQAVAEHQKRMQAEQQLAEARKLRIEAESKQDDSLTNLHKAITKQRLVNRIRAAEDARIANAALQAVQLAKKEIEVKRAINETVATAVERALMRRRDATLLAGQTLVNATGEFTRRVTASVADAARQDTALAVARTRLEALRTQAERSKTDALEAQSQAYEDRARADAAILASAMLNKSKDFEYEKNSNYTTALRNAKGLEKSTTADMVAKVRAQKDAEYKAFEVQGKAITDLEDAADHMGQVDSATKIYEKVARLRPEAFIGGVANSIVGEDKVEPEGVQATVGTLLGTAALPSSLP